jgi:hypothetical protein
VVETTCVLQVFFLFSKLVFPTLDFDMGFLGFAHTPFHFQRVICPSRLYDLHPNLIVAINSKSPFNPFCFTILSSSESIDGFTVLMALTT